VNLQGSRPFFHRGPDPLFTLFSSYLVTFAVIVRFDWSKCQNVSSADDESIGGIGFGDRSVCGRGQAYLQEKVIDDKTHIRSHPNPDKRTICTMLYVTRTIQYISYADGGGHVYLSQESADRPRSHNIAHV
jgi:hypothetical protein